MSILFDFIIEKMYPVITVLHLHGCVSLFSTSRRAIGAKPEVIHYLSACHAQAGKSQITHYKQITHSIHSSACLNREPAYDKRV
ncbi:MAG: hypothetical protein MRJ65_07820 [Candidatus Brocadiaceae bacterium]|nr:hypothetical protein [Candidatus Brocadiaceae bacterium]